MMIYMLIFKVAYEINPGEYPYSFERREVYSPEVTEVMVFMLMLNGLLSFNFFS